MVCMRNVNRRDLVWESGHFVITLRHLVRQVADKIENVDNFRIFMSQAS